MAVKGKSRFHHQKDIHISSPTQPRALLYLAHNSAPVCQTLHFGSLFHSPGFPVLPSFSNLVARPLSSTSSANLSVPLGMNLRLTAPFRICSVMTTPHPFSIKSRA